MKLSRKICDCAQSPIRKFYPYAVAAQQRGIRIHQLNIGQPDIQTPPAFFEAIEAGRRDVLAYAESPGIPALLEAIRAYYARIGASFETQDILVTTGGSEALQMALTCILDEGDEILIPEPFYPNYNTFVSVTGGVIRPIPTTPEEGYRYADRARIEPLINEHTRAILVTNPGNPTGVVLSPEEMRLMADIAKEHGLFLISDEVYREFIYDDEPMGSFGEPLASMAQFDDAAENVVVVDSISKRFSACGARVGILVSRNRELMAQALKICQGRLCAATLDQLGAAALYGVGSDYFSAVREEYHRRRDTCMEGLSQIPGVVCECPKGAFYLMAKLPVDDTDKFQTWLLEEFQDNGETVMFAPGEGFYGTPGKGRDEVRLAYILKQADLRRAMEVLAHGIEAYNSRKL